VSLTALFGALGALALVLGLARSTGRITPSRMLVAGVAVSYLLSATTILLILFADSTQGARAVMFWLLGSLVNADWSTLPIGYAAITAGIAVVFWWRRRLDLLALGDETALASGVDPGRTRLVLVVVIALCVGCAVSLSGGIGFVGLAVPHIARRIVGPIHRHLVPAAATLGAVVLVWADVAARMVLQPRELPIGVVTGVLGAPVLVALVRKLPYNTRAPRSARREHPHELVTEPTPGGRMHRRARPARRRLRRRRCRQHRCGDDRRRGRLRLSIHVHQLRPRVHARCRPGTGTADGSRRPVAALRRRGDGSCRGSDRGLPRGVLHARGDGGPRRNPGVAGRGHLDGCVEVSLEAIIEYEPDIVIGYDTETLTADALADVGIQLYVMPPFCKNPRKPSFDSIVDEVRFYGQLFGTSAIVDPAADALAATVASAADAPVAEGKTAAALYVNSDGSAIYAYSALGMVHPQMEALGMTNVFAELSERVSEVSIEEVIDRNPDVLVLLYDDTGLTPDDIAALVTELPGASSITAVADGAVYPLLFNYAEPPTPLVVKGLSVLSEQITG